MLPQTLWKLEMLENPWSVFADGLLKLNMEDGGDNLLLGLCFAWMFLAMHINLINNDKKR